MLEPTSALTRDHVPARTPRGAQEFSLDHAAKRESLTEIVRALEEPVMYSRVGRPARRFKTELVESEPSHAGASVYFQGVYAHGWIRTQTGRAPKDE